MELGTGAAISLAECAFERTAKRMTAKTDLPKVPADLADVVLIDGPTAAATGGMSVSWWHEAVRKGIAPQPVIRQFRCSRWRMASVREFWLALASRPTDDALVKNAAQASVKGRTPAAKAKAQATKAARRAAQAGA